MERNPYNIAMEQSRMQQQYQYNSMEPGNGAYQSASQAYVLDPYSSINSSVRPPDPTISEVKPVRNYSIQTGEEFALEFMRDRVIPKKPLIPDIVGDPNYATGYMELKGILGISHTGSESGSDISMLTIGERGPKEYERKNSSLHEDRSNYGSVQAVPQTSSGYDSHRGLVHEYTSSEASDSSSSKMKVLCSFGGKILPRPSDGKLRYVGGETRIIRITKNISWQKLRQKTMEVYNQTYVIKYQLPGEDLDALVSVSCDEDLQNMMEESNELEDREGSQRLRMFLLSRSDLADAHTGLSSMDGDSEIQYVVAVNGMDLGSRKSLNLHGLRNSSANDLDELGGNNIERGISRVATGSTDVSTSPLTGNTVPSSTIPSSVTILPSSSNAYEIYPQFYHGQMMHHREIKEYPVHYGHDPSNYSPFGENPTTMPPRGHINRQGGLSEGHSYGIAQVQNPQMMVRPGEVLPNGSVQHDSDIEKISPSDKPIPSRPYDGKVMKNFPVEEAAVAAAVRGGEPSLCPSESEGKHQQHEKFIPSADAMNAERVPKCSGDDLRSTSNKAFSPGYADPDSNPIDLSSLEPPAPPPRIYYSEKIPRAQAGSLNRLSKSDDSLGSQFLVSHSRSDIIQQESVPESDEQLHNSNLTSHTEQSVSHAIPLCSDPQTIDDGLAQFQKYREFAEAISQMNSDLSGEMLDLHELKQAVSNPLDNKDTASKDGVLKVESDTKSLPDYQKKILVDENEEAGSEPPAVSQVASIMQHEGLASNLSELNGGEKTGQDSSTVNIQEHPQPFPWEENSTEDAFSDGISAPGRVDIRVDIDDRFPRDFLSDIYSKAVLSEDSSGINPVLKGGAGVSVNMANHEPKRWSYFRNLAQEEFGQTDVSIIDQDHLGISSALREVEGESRSYHPTPSTNDVAPMIHVDTKLNFGEDNQKSLPRPFGVDASVSESMQFDAMMENLRTPQSEYEEGNLGNRNTGLPPLDPSLVDFDITSLQAIKNEDLEEQKELGSGTFGTVYHGKWRGTDVAIKRIKKSCFTGRSSEQERLTVEFWKEAEILSKLHHPNVVAFYGVVQDGPGGTLATVAEYMVDGSLRHVLVRKDRYLDRRKRLIIAMDAAFGMEYLHSKNIVHFDLKCDNLLVNLKDPSRPICKVGDFGLSKIKRNTLVSGGVRGTLPWMAPELLSGSSSKVSEKVDVFSFGIVLWEILTGEEPYANMHYGAIIGGIVNNSLRPTIPSFCDAEWTRLMEECWAPNPAVRPSFTEIARRLRVMSTAANQAKTHGHKASK
ncbi:hypothetical protein JRO89_XS11G0229600 [Xanthoceras sorbifolium]|uniref:Protein kinase domain-containing protein n=1 Tax=Xanthoceras sorbifolium TaxID=99658 RepID=A0ABQ8HGW9_9ROSI|nr:hypothetical protein JRO89_XS11G0229600 [Xanthoceras sorbifolium]